MRTALFLVASVCLTFAQSATPPPHALRTPIVVEKDTRIEPGRYVTTPGQNAFVIRTSKVTLDLTGVEIDGGGPGEPDSFQGIGVQVDNASDVTIKGGFIHGFKFGVLARRAPKLHITGTDVSYNWKPRLKSGIEQEDQSDWLYFHNNEKDEWLRYGAAISLTEADDAEIDHTRAVQGMNGLMVTRSARLKVWSNTYSWLSGLGIGFYRTTDSRVTGNRLDFCVRGYSHGFYNRGQDSSGILLYEQSSRNVVAFNSITHGGDGVFLWAGQSTMDSGDGGANDNVFYQNDVSSAVANGIEATFSRNIFVRNRIDDCWHGIWGGYSFDSLIAENSFNGNTEGIAIEHGQNITIRGNRFSHEDTAIRLWANTSQDPNWGYPKHRDTRSRDYVIAKNQFDAEKVAVDLIRTSSVRIGANTFASVGTKIKSGAGLEDVTEFAFDPPLAAPAFSRPEPMKGVSAPAPLNLAAAGARPGRGAIIVDVWGPYDYKSPKLWPAAKPGDRPLRMRVLGPPGRWQVASLRGVSSTTTTGVVPGEIVLQPSGTGADLTVELEYRGAAIVTPRGEKIAAGQPYRFSYSLFEPAIDWTVRFWKFDTATDPLSAGPAFENLLASTPPVRTERMTRLAYANAAAFGAGYTSRIGINADGTIDLAPGNYTLSITTDDGIRLWIDDRLVLEDWTIHGPKEDRLPITGGHHQLRVEYFQNTGAAALMVRIDR